MTTVPHAPGIAGFAATTTAIVLTVVLVCAFFPVVVALTALSVLFGDTAFPVRLYGWVRDAMGTT